MIDAIYLVPLPKWGAVISRALFHMMESMGSVILPRGIIALMRQTASYSGKSAGVMFASRSSPQARRLSRIVPRSRGVAGVYHCPRERKARLL